MNSLTWYDCVDVVGVLLDVCFGVFFTVAFRFCFWFFVQSCHRQMRIGDGKLNLEEDESWLNDYARAFMMSCFRVQPKPDIVNFPTWKYSMWCTHPAQTGVSHNLSTSPSLFPKRELYKVLHCWLLLQALVAILLTAKRSILL